MKYITTINDKKYEIEIQRDGRLLVNGKECGVDFMPLGASSLFSIVTADRSHEVVIEERNDAVEVLMGGRLFTVSVMDERAQLLASRGGPAAAETGEISIKSPMPGLVAGVPVSEGDEVQAGQTVIILESMKMQNELKTPREGVVTRIHVTAGQSVEQNKVLITIT